MQVTKYPQSCLLLEKDGQKILIVPGSFAAGKFSADDFSELDAIMLTHRHPDHANPELITALLSKKAVPVYANANTKDLLGELVSDVIEPDQSVNIASFSVQVYDMPHCPLPDGSAGPPNNGYLFDDHFLHCGDGVTIENLQVETAAVPIAGPDISLRDAADLIKSIRAKKVIPIHYSIFSDDKPMPATGLVTMGAPDTEIIVLNVGESTTL